MGTIGPKEAGEYFFHKLYLSPFDDGQVKKYLRLRYRFWRWRKRRQALKVASQIQQLTARPMLLAYIDDLLASRCEFAYSFQLYEEMVEAWLQREVGRVGVLRKEPLREFCERLAIGLFTLRRAEGSERLPFEAIEPLARGFGIKLEGWKLTGRSLLNRDAEDNFKFAHRSIMEYLFVKRFLAIPVTERPALTWTDQMKRFLWEIVQANKPKPLDLSNVDLLGLAEITGTPSLSLRHKPKDVSYEQAEEMIKHFGFFDSFKNKSGRGISHAYVPYVRHQQTLVLDLATGLTWQQAGSPNYMTYTNAEKYIRDLNKQRFAGYEDWRLPTLEEAMSLMEPRKHGELYIDPVFDHEQRWIWTSDKESAGRAWCVGFDNGDCDPSDIGSSNYVRAVRP
ncbi:MAG: DUF1566 domain-containing protein [candidate division KSB1 bacterium]|nr:DUF1566 domain-containing protein [candidate division KSB1 bacterium]